MPAYKKAKTALLGGFCIYRVSDGLNLEPLLQHKKAS
jgi:hypothetical protein